MALTPAKKQRHYRQKLKLGPEKSAEPKKNTVKDITLTRN